jgi:hypothetical protein
MLAIQTTAVHNLINLCHLQYNELDILRFSGQVLRTIWYFVFGLLTLEKIVVTNEVLEPRHSESQSDALTTELWLPHFKKMYLKIALNFYRKIRMRNGIIGASY